MPETKAPPTPAGSIHYTRDEWYAEGKRLFGDDMMQWRFVCPICGQVQKPEDFRQYAPGGAQPSSAYAECIGRYLHRSVSRSAFEPKKGDPEKPCDYAAFGLLRVAPVAVEGYGFPIFDFDRSGEKGAAGEQT